MPQVTIAKDCLFPVRDALAKELDYLTTCPAYLKDRNSPVVAPQISALRRTIKQLNRGFTEVYGHDCNAWVIRGMKDEEQG